MRVAKLASLGALAVAGWAAAAQPPATSTPPPPPSSTTPTDVPPPSTPMPTPMPPGTAVPPTAPPGTTATPLPTPTPVPGTATTPLPPPAWATYQPQPTVASAFSNAVASVPPGPFSDLAHSYNRPMRGPQTWGNVEYLLWWIKPGPLPTPLVNTTIVAEDLSRSIAAGGIQDPLSTTILGGKSVDFGTFSGIRFGVGHWFDCCQETGAEVSMFFLQRKSETFSANGGTNANGTPELTVPFNSVGPGPVVGETSAAIGGLFNGVPIVGTINERMNSTLWGADVDGLFNLWKAESWRFDAVGGFKYVDLYEDLFFATAIRTPPFGATEDRFRTANNFYGGDLGGRITTQFDRWGMQLTGRVALGDTVQTVDIRGTSVAPTTFGGMVGPGGFFAQSSNIGKTDRSRFSVIPEVNGSVSFDVNCHLKLLAGYNFMYWTHVVRPGDQIDRNINPNLVPVFGGSAAGVGAAIPSRLNKESDFWAHGVNLGVQVSW
jgi:hypothetical protein